MIYSPLRPRVLHLVGAFLPVTQNWIYPQVTEVPEVDGAVLCRYRENPLEFPLEKGRLFSQALGGFGSPSMARRLFRGLLRRAGWPAETIARVRAERWRPSILHAHFGPSGWEALPLARRCDIPLVTSFYGQDAWSLPTEQSIWRERYSDLFMKGDLFLVEGPAMRKRLMSLGCSPEKIRIHRIGVKTELLRFEKRDFSAGLKIAMVGRLVEKKGFVDGLRACMAARKAGIELTVTVVGDALSEDAGSLEIKKQMHEIAHSGEMAGRVRFAGFLPQSETSRVLELHNVLLSPSRHAANDDAEGGSPVVLTESMAMGLLCIGSRHCDIPEVIVDQETGFLFDEGDVDGLGRILLGLIASCEPLQQMTLRGRKHVERNFHQVRQLAALSKIYRDRLAV